MQIWNSTCYIVRLLVLKIWHLTKKFKNTLNFLLQILHNRFFVAKPHSLWRIIILQRKGLLAHLFYDKKLCLSSTIYLPIYLSSIYRLCYLICPLPSCEEHFSSSIFLLRELLKMKRADWPGWERVPRGGQSGADGSPRVSSPPQSAH